MDHLQGAPELPADVLARIEAGPPPADQAALTERIYAVAAAIRARRPRGFRDRGRWGPNWPTAELKSEIRDAVRRGQPFEQIAKLLDVNKELVAAIAAAGAAWRLCPRCGGVIDDNPHQLGRVERRMLAALAAGGLLAAADWAAAAESAPDHRFAARAGEMQRAGLVQKHGQLWGVTQLGRGGCVACHGRAAARRFGRRGGGTFDT